MKKMYSILYLFAGLIFLAIAVLEYIRPEPIKCDEEQTEAKGMYFTPEFDGQELTISDNYMYGKPWSERFFIGEGGKWKLVKTITHEP